MSSSITTGSKVKAERFPSTPDLRLFPQMRKFIGHEGTVVDRQRATVLGKEQEVALVEFRCWSGRYYKLTGETVRFVWPVSHLRSQS